MFFHEREIWYCSLGANIGFEQDGKGEDFLRPVLVLKKFNDKIFWGIPLSKSIKPIPKKSDKFYFVFSFVPGVKSLAILSQLRLIDASRLARHIGEMEKEEYQDLTKKLKALLP
ncbi:MAG: type II toxin-antitoxin system PemK/MazF family toxin [Candidatus Paceibacterota bacterium]